MADDAREVPLETYQRVTGLVRAGILAIATFTLGMLILGISRSEMSDHE